MDESGFSISMTRLRSRAPRGKRAYGKVPRNRGKNQTLIASVSLEGAMGECMCIEGATDKAVFEAYVEKALAPSLHEGQVVVLDGLGAHRTARVRELIEGRGCELLFLPSYSPDLNPIEEAFSKIKNMVRKAGARTREALNECYSRSSEGDHAEGRGGMVLPLRLLRVTGSIFMNSAVRIKALATADRSVPRREARISRRGLLRDANGASSPPSKKSGPVSVARSQRRGSPGEPLRAMGA